MFKEKILEKPVFLETRLFAHAQLCGNIVRNKCKCIQFNTLTFFLRFRFTKWKIVQ